VVIKKAANLGVSKRRCAGAEISIHGSNLMEMWFILKKVSKNSGWVSDVRCGRA